MIFTGPAARIPAEAPKHADAPSGARGIRAKANRIRVRRASLLFAASCERTAHPGGRSLTPPRDQAATPALSISPAMLFRPRSR
jgi:hypothetical protein